MMRLRDVDPRIRRFFPWALFLAVAVALMLAASCVRSEGEEDVWACYGSARYEAMSSNWTPCNEMGTLCIKVREYLAQGHTPEEGRALAKAEYVPVWIIHKAERCIK